jgi:hypothetical protein
MKMRYPMAQVNRQSDDSVKVAVYCASASADEQRRRLLQDVTVVVCFGLAASLAMGLF